MLLKATTYNQQMMHLFDFQKEKFHSQQVMNWKFFIHFKWVLIIMCSLTYPSWYIHEQQALSIEHNHLLMSNIDLSLPYRFSTSIFSLSFNIQSSQPWNPWNCWLFYIQIYYISSNIFYKTNRYSILWSPTHFQFMSWYHSVVKYMW